MGGLYLVDVSNRLFSFFVLPQRKKQRKRHFCELLRTQKEPGCVFLWLARPLFASSANASCSAAVVLKFEVMADENEILIGHWFGVMCCFSFGCDFGLCPIVPDEWEGGERKSGERLSQRGSARCECRASARLSMTFGRSFRGDTRWK